MRYGGTAAGFTPAEAKAPPLKKQHSTARTDRQETEEQQQRTSKSKKNRRKKTQETDRLSLEQNTVQIPQRAHPSRAGQARQDE